MLALERRNEILKLIQQQHTVYVNTLSRRFGVTDETIRRDLERLEETGSIVRTHGGAMLSSVNTTKLEQSATIRKKTNTTEKTAIAGLVADMVSDGDDIMLDDSSTSLFVAHALKKKRNLTVITNSLEILTEVKDQADWHVMGTGGVLRERSMSFVGNQAENMISNYYVDKAIISCKGFDLSRGFTDSTEASALVKRCMLNAAKEVILAVDSSKFGLISFVQIGQINRLSAIVTDREPSGEYLSIFSEIGVKCRWPGSKAEEQA